MIKIEKKAHVRLSGKPNGGAAIAEVLPLVFELLELAGDGAMFNEIWTMWLLQ
jgi:hypothetical protein